MVTNELKLLPNVVLAILIPGYVDLSFFVKSVSSFFLSFTLSHFHNSSLTLSFTFLNN